MSVTDKATRHRGAAFDGSAAGTDPADFFCCRDWQLEHRAQYSDWFSDTRFAWIAGNLSADSAGSAGLCRALCAISTLIFLDALWIASAAMKHRDRGDAAAGAGGGPVVAGGNPAV